MFIHDKCVSNVTRGWLGSRDDPEARSMANDRSILNTSSVIWDSNPDEVVMFGGGFK